MDDDPRVIVLSSPVEYDGDETTRIPATEISDHGGMYVVECPDGSSRAFDKSNVLDIQSPHDDAFTHQPDDHHTLDPDGLMSFDEAEHLQADDTEKGMGFVLNRHDTFIVVEIANAVHDGSIAEFPQYLFSKLGDTFTEVDDDETLLRAMYTGADELDESLGIVSGRISTDDNTYPVRIFDSGWTPVSGQHIPETPTDCEPINTTALDVITSRLN